MRKQVLAISLLSASLVGGCASYKPVAPAFHQALNEPYRLDSGDRVRITVFEQASLTNSYAVDKSGYVSIPLVGDVPARGRTTDQVGNELTERFSDGYLRDPDITVEVEQYRPFFIMGEVETGGQYSYVPGMTVQNAVAISGGYTPRADQKTVDVTRKVGGRILTGRVLASDPILPGDTLYIRERLF